MVATGQAVRIPARPAVDEAAARRTLRDQIARLERELTAIDEPLPAAARAGTPRLLCLGELEAVRDRLLARVAAGHRAQAERALRRHDARIRLERMLLEPGRHRFARVTAAELGEGGCGVYAVRPRLGLVGMLMGWWQVKLSSGCPLAA